MWEKRKFSVRDISSTTYIISKIPMVGVYENKVMSLVFIMIQWLTSLGHHFIETDLSICGKKRGFSDGEKEK